MSHEPDQTLSQKNAELVPKDEKAELGSGTDLEAVFEIQSEIARGGMGIIYKGFHRQLQRHVAIKVLLASENQTALKRFMKEARLVSSFEHPNIVKIYSVGYDKSQRPFFAMEWLEGETLADKLRTKKRLNITEFKQIFHQAMEALSYAHQKKIVHRDIKPSNIFLTKDESGGHNVKLLDFGIARAVDKENSEGMKLTSTGTLLGTPRYMSPEQCNSEQVDERTDVYSLAVVMFEALSGSPLFESDNPLEIMYKQLKESPDSSKLPQGAKFQSLNYCILKALAKDPSERFQSVETLSSKLSSSLSALSDEDLQELRQIKSSSKIHQSMTSLLCISALVLLVAGLGIYNIAKNPVHTTTASPSLYKSLDLGSSKLSCEAYRTKAKDACLQLYLAKKRKDWASADRYAREAEALLNRAITAGQNKIDELTKQAHQTETQSRALNTEFNEVHNAGFELGTLLFDQGRLEDAIKALDIAIEYARSNYNLAAESVAIQSIILHYQCKYEKALLKLNGQRRWMEEALAIERKNHPSDKGILPNRDFFFRLGEIWQDIGDVYCSQRLPDRAAGAYARAETTAEVNNEIEANSVAMFIRGKLASIFPQRWPASYKEAREMNKMQIKAYRSAEVLRMYANYLAEKGDKDQARKIYNEAKKCFEYSEERIDSGDADGFAAIIRSSAEFEIESQLKNNSNDFQKALEIAKEGETFCTKLAYSPRLRGVTNYLRGVDSYLHKDYDKAIKLFELVELDCKKDPYSVAHLAKLLHANSFLKKGDSSEAQKQFLELNPKFVPFLQTIQKGPSYMTESLNNCADAFEKDHNDEYAKLIRTRMADARSGRDTRFWELRKEDHSP